MISEQDEPEPVEEKPRLTNKEIYSNLKMRLKSIRDSCGEVCDTDKEGIDGPSFINVDVTCHRLQTFDPGLLNRIFYMGRSVGGQVVNIISLYSDNPSSIPA